jgi:hypothetical protein
MNYYYSTDGNKVLGPHSLDELLARHRSGALPGTTQVCAEGQKTWQRIDSFDPPPTLPLAKQDQGRRIRIRIDSSGPPPPLPPTQQAPPKKSPARTFGLGCAGISAIFLLLVIAVALVSSDGGSGTGSSCATSTRRVEDDIAAQHQAAANQNKQQIFDLIHPIGTAKSVTVHDVTITNWKRGQATNRFDDVLQYTVRFTLYWQGPITTDGYTKITQTVDKETGRNIIQILATNGFTKKEVGEALGELVGALLYNALTK